MPDATTAKIAELNDQARQTFGECRVVITQGVSELGKCDVAYILDKVRKYKDFTPLNDPYFEHDFGLPIPLKKNRTLSRNFATCDSPWLAEFNEVVTFPGFSVCNE